MSYFSNRTCYRARSVSYTPPSFGVAVGPSGYYSRAASVDPDISFTYSITQPRAERSSRLAGPEPHCNQLQSYHVPSPKPRSRSLFDDRYRPSTNYYSKYTPSMLATKARTAPGNRYSSDHSQREENFNIAVNSGSILRHQKLATRPGVYDNITGRSRMAGGAGKLVSMTKWLDEEDKIPPPQPADASTRKPFVADRPSKISAQALSDNKQLLQDKNITSCYINKGRMAKDKDCRMTTADSVVSSTEDFRNRKAAKFDEVAKSPGGGREVMSCRAAPTVTDTCLDIESNLRLGIKAEKKPQSGTGGSTISTTNYLKLFKFKSLSLGRCKKNKSCDLVEETSSTLAPPRATAAAVVLPKAEPDGKNKQARNTVAGGGKTAAATTTTNMVKKATHVDTSYNQSLSSSKIPVYFSYTHKIPFDIAGNVNASPSRMSKGHIPSHQAPASGQGDLEIVSWKPPLSSSKMPRKSALLSSTVEAVSAGGAKNKTIRDVAIKDYSKFHQRSAGSALSTSTLPAGDNAKKKHPTVTRNSSRAMSSSRELTQAQFALDALKNISNVSKKWNFFGKPVLDIPICIP